TGRALGFVVLGACVGLLIAIVQELVKQAELKIISGGRNEGREFRIDKKRVTIGSSNRNDWVIAGDQFLQPQHVEIKREGGHFVLRALNPAAATAVNNQRVVAQALNNGDRIQIGGTLLTFTVRNP
ncbi:MAG TPA: FHA domain-containing protein, partial [Anaerolineae bacterium]|nr:FHA domain-containing protein [Anaerolineae bacterium]